MTIASLNTKILALEARVEALEKKPAKAPKAEKKPKDPDAPKREANWFIKAMGPIREALKPLIDAHNATLPEGTKKLNGADAPRVGRILNEAGLMSKEIQPSEAEIKEAVGLFLSGEAGEPKGPALRAQAAAKRASANSSVASEGSGAKAGKPKAEVSEEEAAAKRAAKAAKAAATRAANKAKKAEAEAEKPAVEAEVVNDTAEVIDTEEVEMDIGKGLKTYERIVYGGVTYIYTADGDNFLGTWDEAKKVLNKNGKDIKNM